MRPVTRQHAYDALRGLALGDSFGDTWFRRPAAELAQRTLKPAPWPWTDDTALAIPLYLQLAETGEVRVDALAARFASAYAADKHRKYGSAMHDVLQAFGDGQPWQDVTRSQFDGQGSWGNGAAMRVPPLGAWFAGDLDRVVEQARLSAIVTHAHPEAVAGAIAVAVTAALAVDGVPAGDIIAATLARTPDSEVAARLRQVADRPFTDEPASIAAEVGSGLLLSAPDTVPYTIWCAARHLDDLEAALWATVSGGGDTDTTCAMVGGIIAGRAGLSSAPAEWLAAAEPLPSLD
jgi:ADP-ribosylglycohydrolase